jgi:hypothetical protein
MDRETRRVQEEQEGEDECIIAPKAWQGIFN